MEDSAPRLVPGLTRIAEACSRVPASDEAMPDLVEQVVLPFQTALPTSRRPTRTWDAGHAHVPGSGGKPRESRKATGRAVATVPGKVGGFVGMRTSCSSIYWIGRIPPPTPRSPRCREARERGGPPLCTGSAGVCCAIMAGFPLDGIGGRAVTGGSSSLRGEAGTGRCMRSKAALNASMPCWINTHSA